MRWAQIFSGAVAGLLGGLAVAWLLGLLLFLGRESDLGDARTAVMVVAPAVIVGPTIGAVLAAWGTKPSLAPDSAPDSHDFT